MVQPPPDTPRNLAARAGGVKLQRDAGGSDGSNNAAPDMLHDRRRVPGASQTPRLA
jgi:hypothetical protein